MEVERYYLLGRRDAVQAKLDEVQNLQKSASALRERVRQLIEITDEDHGKAIRVFTIVTVLFLPMYVPSLSCRGEAVASSTPQIQC